MCNDHVRQDAQSMPLSIRSWRVALTLTALSLLNGLSTTSRAQTTDGLGRTVTKWFSTNGEAPSNPKAAPTRPSTEVGEHILRQTTCNIPFTVDPTRPPPLELQLFVSVDRGAKWQLTAQSGPSAGHFAFHATQDGEYWFALRTIERTGRPPDPQKLQPGLKVVFDTHEPEMQFEAKFDADGEIHATWKISDPYLSPESLKIEYQTGPQELWQTVEIPARREPTEGPLTGGCTWNPGAASSSVVVRAEIQDRAGNNAVVTRSVTIASSDRASSDRASSDRASSDRASSDRASSDRASSERAEVRGASNDRNKPTATAEVSTVENGSIPWPLNNVLPIHKVKKPGEPGGELPPPKPSANHPPTALHRDSMRNPYFSTASQAIDDPGVHAVQPRTAPRDSIAPTESAPPDLQQDIIATPEPAQAPNVNPADEADSRSPNVTIPQDSGVTRSRTDDNGGSTVRLPGGEKPRMTNSRRFSLEYEVEAIGPAAVNKVELWGTQDGGETWKRWMNDDDRTSPVDVQVAKDGVYGFRIVIIATNQLSSPTPQAGELADVWVGVDSSKPVVRITSASYGEAEHAGKLDIRWDADDEWFADRPIKLSFSEQLDGTWNTIAAGLPNVGQYLWSVEPRIPRQIYLRIDAYDEAGNTSTHLLTEPINTAGLVPQARIRGVHVTPLNDHSASRSPGKR